MLNVQELKNSVKVNDILADALVKELEAEEEKSHRKRKHGEDSSSQSDASDAEDGQSSARKKHKKTKKKKKHKKHKKKKSKSKSKDKDSNASISKDSSTCVEINVSEERPAAEAENKSESKPVEKVANQGELVAAADSDLSATKKPESKEQSQEADEESCEEGQIKDTDDEKDAVEPSGKHHHKKHKHHHKKRKRSHREHKHHVDSDSERHARADRSSSPHRHRRHSHTEKHSAAKEEEKHRARSRSPVNQRENLEKIDKEELRRIARRNLLEMIETGNLPKGVNMDMIKREWIEDLKSEKKDVNEWTEFCRALSKMEQEEDDNGELARRFLKQGQDSDDDGDTPFIHHPFKLRETQPTIRMNIKNAVQIPIKTQAEKAASAAKLRLQFPVSSGSQHRMKEFEWVPVTEDSDTNKVSKASSSVKSEISVPSKDPNDSSSQSSDVGLQPFYLPSGAQKAEMGYPLLSYPHLQPSAASIAAYSAPSISEAASVFSSPECDLSSIMAQRLHAIRLLQEDPTNVEAQRQALESQKRMQDWVQSKQQPGMFTGSTDAKLLSPEELSGPVPAWAKKDQFSRAHPVREGIGMHLLKKMGWNPGEGLGKNKEGALEPLLPDIKTDKRGLVSGEDLSKKMVHMVAKDMQGGKHPVSALTELCTKRRWGPPEFQLLDESGPDHRKSFLFRVRVNGIDYQPGVSSSTKKQAKASAALVCLQSLGIPLN